MTRSSCAGWASTTEPLRAGQAAAEQPAEGDASHLYCRIPEDGSFSFIQTNTYTWEDGRQEVFDFGGRIEGEVAYFDTERIIGEMSQADDQTIVLTWSYKDDPDNYLYELIQLSRDGRHKCRTWHWMDGDRLVKRTIISETKVA